MDKPLVSVIIPNYNYERFLVQRIESVLNQSYENIEVILLDDKSTDDSKSILQQYSSHPKVAHVVINEENSGSTFKQWNRGFALAKGEYIWIAESDDYADLSFLDSVVGEMLKDRSIIVGFSNSNWVLPESTFINQDYTVPEPVTLYDGRQFIRQHLMKENYIYNASMAVFRRDAIANVNPDYQTYKSCGDKLFWSSLAIQGKVVFVCKPLNYFRIHNSKVTTKSIANGTLFREEHRLFDYNLSQGYLDSSNRLDTVLYFIRYVHNVEREFISEEVHQECLNMWQDECDPHNSKLPMAFRIQCFLSKITSKKYKELAR